MREFPYAPNENLGDNVSSIEFEVVSWGGHWGTDERPSCGLRVGVRVLGGGVPYWLWANVDDLLMTIPSRS